jgi:hypothetical protein
VVNKNKKAQIAIFLVIAIIIIFGAIFVMVASYRKGNSDLNAGIDTHTTDSARSFVEYCLSDISKEALVSAGENGGYLDDFPPTLRKYLTEKTYFYILYDGRYYLQTENAIEKSIASRIDRKMPECVRGLKDVNGIGTIEFGMPNSTVSFQEEDVLVSLDYPVVVTKGKAETRMGKFNLVLPIRIKKEYAAAKEIISTLDEYASQHSGASNADPQIIEQKYVDIISRYETDQIFIYHYTVRESLVTLWLIKDNSTEEPFYFQFATQMN